MTVRLRRPKEEETGARIEIVPLIDIMFFLQHRARPHTCRHGVAATHTDSLPLKLVRIADGRMRVVQDGAMMKGPNEENWQRREPHAVLACA